MGSSYVVLREDTTLAVALCGCAPWSKRCCGGMLRLFRFCAFFQAVPAACLSLYVLYLGGMCPGESVLKVKVDHCYNEFITACSALAFGCMHI